mmetsp:Transcript_9290/g.23030  ORF Transcript_9290/g.23030 Transcript_9290/m.23030 type:complete len:230 (+) Transcript_9290:876-1565(+)
MHVTITHEAAAVALISKPILAADHIRWAVRCAWQLGPPGLRGGPPAQRAVGVCHRVVDLVQVKAEQPLDLLLADGDGLVVVALASVRDAVALARHVAQQPAHGVLLALPLVQHLDLVVGPHQAQRLVLVPVAVCLALGGTPGGHVCVRYVLGLVAVVDALVAVVGAPAAPPHLGQHARPVVAPLHLVRVGQLEKKGGITAANSLLGICRCCAGGGRGCVVRRRCGGGRG